MANKLLSSDYNLVTLHQDIEASNYNYLLIN